MKLAVQCDFDGTITREDVSFLILDEFAGDWRPLMADYMAGKMPVGTFNRMAFNRIKAGLPTLVDFTLNNERIEVRPGFKEMLAYCREKGHRFVITSNGVDFYVEALLKDMGLADVEFYAAVSQMDPAGMKVQYIAPDGRELEAGFKEAYTDMLINEGYDVVYIGNGISDIFPARKAVKVFATADLVTRCEETGLAYTPFDDFHDVMRGLEGL